MHNTHFSAFNSIPILPSAGYPGLQSDVILQRRGIHKMDKNRRGQVVAHALNGLDLEVKHGDFVSIMGASGSGKSTLLNLLAGLDRPTGGELWLQGVNMASQSADQLALFRRRHLGFVFQDFNLLDTLTLAENVALPLSLDGMVGSVLRQRVEEVMSFLGIAQYMHRYPYEVSGGQQQRAAVARAVVHRPGLILADEPTGNLDSASAKALLELFQRLNNEMQATILMVTHDPLSASYSRRVVSIQDGRIFQELVRSSEVQQSFFQQILALLAQMEGQNGVA